MKKLKKIKLSNIKDSQLEKEQLIHLKGGYSICRPDCSSVRSYFEVLMSNE